MKIQNYTFSFVLIFTIIFLNSCHRKMYEVFIDHKQNKVIKGEFTFDDLKSDSSFLWFDILLDTADCDVASLRKIEENKDVEIIMIGGTWCGDTKFHLPHFYKILEQTSYPMTNVRLIGVDRDKKDLKGFSDKYHIERVPTFIFLKNGKEIGRIVENPLKTLEQDWAEILTQ